MELFFAVILTAAIVVIGCYLYIKRYEKEVSVVVTSTNEKQAYDLFLNKVGSKIPKDILKVVKHANGTMEFIFKVKSLK